jgi:hypothetical protein
MLFALSYILIPMDESQTDHLRAYGVVYWAISRGYEVEWLLNFRGGSFLIYSNSEEVKRRLASRGVYYETLGESDRLEIEGIIEKGNMSKVKLQSLPKLAVYAPKYVEPWDDAVMLALDYAEIPYDLIWDEEILQGKLKNYDWVHLHHEDFTGMFGKFWAGYSNAPWYIQMVQTSENVAKKYKFKGVRELKLEVAKRIKEFVSNGGYLFAMCSAPITLDIALAAENVDILDVPFDGDPVDPNYQEKLDFSKTLFLKYAKVITNPYIYEHTDADATRDIASLGENSYFYLYEFSAKIDEIPTMLTQNHTRAIKEFLGQDSGVYKDKLKNYVVVLAENTRVNAAKYIFAPYGKGFFSFYFGHDPEDYQHFVGEPPTDLSKHKNSPSYRIILNNIFLPSAQKKKLKT